MRVLVVTGDPSFKPGNRRFDMQAQATSALVPIYFGPQSFFPKVPQGMYDVVTTQDPFWRGLFALYVARKKHVRFNVQLHADFGAQHWTKKLVGKFVLKKADSIRVVSEKLKKQIETLGVTAPITVLPIFIDIEKFKHLVRKPSVPPTILWVGRFEKEKDPLKAVAVFKELVEQGVAARLVMLGAGTLEQELKKRASGLSVEFPGWQDPKEYLQKASLVLSTSPTESWGASIIEALSAGVPTVSFDVGVAREAGATIVDPETLVATVASILKTPQSAELALPVLSEGEWVQLWKQSLI